MNRLSLKVKLGLGFGAILTIMAIVGFVGFYGTYRLSDAMSKVESNGAKALTTESMDAAVEKQTTGVRGFLLAGKEDLLKHDQEGQQEFKENADKLEKGLVTEHGKKLFAEIKRSFEAFRSIADREVQLRRAGKNKEAEALAFSSEAAQVRTEMRKALAELMALEQKLLADGIAEGRAVESSTRTMILAFAICGSIIGILVAFFIVRSITGGMARMVTLIQHIAGNNLAVDDMQVV